jgi:transcriptional regulator with XRE-family HTH domain
MQQEINYGKYVGECIKQARLMSKMSKRSFASQLGVRHNDLARIERGKIEIPFGRLSRIFYWGIVTME